MAQTKDELILELILKDEMSAQAKVARDAVTAMTDAEKKAIVTEHEHAEALKSVSDAAEKGGTAQLGMRDSINSIKGSWTEFSSALGIAEQMFGKVQQALKMTVGETITYAAQVRELSRTIGASAEESSVLIQAADDVGISVGTIQTAMESAIRKGVRPTIEGLAELAAEYNAIEDPIAKTEFLMKNFGRAGADLAPLMKLGAAGLREAGQAARDSGLIMTEEGVKSAREYEIAMDNLGDAAKGVQYEIGTALIPILVSAANAANLLATQDQQLGNVLNAHTAEIIKAADGYSEYVKEMQRTADATGMSIDAEGNLVQVYGEGDVATQRLIQSNFILTESQYKLKQATLEGTSATDESVRALGRVVRADDEAIISKAKYAGILASVTDKAIAYTDAEQKIADKEKELAGVNVQLQTAWGDNVKKLEEQKVALESTITTMQKASEIERAKEIFAAFGKALADGKINEEQYTAATTELNQWTNLYSDSALRAAQQQEILVNMIQQGKVPLDEQIAALSGARESFDGFIFKQTEAGASAQQTAADMREAALATKDFATANAQVSAAAVPIEAGDRTERMITQLNNAKKAAADFGDQAETVKAPLVAMSDNALVAAGSLSEVKRVISEVGAVSADNTGLVLNLSGALEKIPRNIPITISITTVGGVPELPQPGANYAYGPAGGASTQAMMQPFMFEPGSIVIYGAAGQSPVEIAQAVSVQIAARARAMNLARVAAVR